MERSEQVQLEILQKRLAEAEAKLKQIYFELGRHDARLDRHDNRILDLEKN